MRLLFIIFILTTGNIVHAQELKTITYRQWQDLPQDTYVRIMHTADSLLNEYQWTPFQFEKKDGGCCFKGLLVVNEFYQRALIEQPDDEDAKSKIIEVDNLIKDEALLLEEKEYALIAQRGDFYFEKGFYKIAYKFYHRAYEISMGDKSIKKKIKLTKKRIKKYQNI